MKAIDRLIKETHIMRHPKATNGYINNGVMTITSRKAVRAIKLGQPMDLWIKENVGDRTVEFQGIVKIVGPISRTATADEPQE
jgi:hypothetical protein